jgi:hypothetical protein
MQQKVQRRFQQLQKKIAILKHPPRNRLLHSYINIATTRYTKPAGATTQSSPKEKRKGRETKMKKGKESNVHNVGSTKTMMIRNCCALWRIPTTLLALCSSAYQARTFKKGCDNVDAAARTGPRVFPGTRRGTEKKGYTRCPSRRSGGAHGRHRIGAGLPTGISADPQKNYALDTPSYSTKLTAHRLAPP